MSWQEPIVFIIVGLAIFYAGKTFLAQFGRNKKTDSPTCSACSSCDNPITNDKTQLIQISTNGDKNKERVNRG